MGLIVPILRHITCFDGGIVLTRVSVVWVPAPTWHPQFDRTEPDTPVALR